MNNRRFSLRLAAVIGLITFAVYLPALGNDFVGWDDDLYIFANTNLRSPGLSFLRWAFSTFYAGNWHPVTWISHALDYALWGLNPLGHHLTSVVFHALNTSLVVLLCARLLEYRWRRSLPPRDADARGRERATLVASAVSGLLFGLHPVHVESVAWVAERKDVLCSFFFLLSMLAYVKHVQSIHEQQEPPLLSRAYGFSFALFIFAVLSKPMAVTLPLALLIADWYPFQRLRSMKSARAAFLEKLPFFAISVVSSIMTFLAQKRFGAVAGAEAFPFETRTLVAVRSLALYLWSMVSPFHLSPFYPYPPQREITLFSPHILLAAVFFIGMTAYSISRANKHSVWLTAWAYYVLLLLPVLGLIQVGRQAMADRYAYLPSFGPFFLAGLGAAWIWMRTHGESGGKTIKAIALSLALVLCIGMSLLTMKQIGVWKSSITLWSAIIEKEPDRAPFAYYNRGVAFREKGQALLAIQDYTRAIALDPRYDAAYLNRGMAYMESGRTGEAIDDYSSAIALNPAFYLAYNNRGVAYKKIGDLDRAVADYDAAIALEPGRAEAFINRGTAFDLKGLTARALEDYTRAIQLNPSFYAAYVNRGAVFKNAGRFSQAIEDYSMALLLNTNYAPGYLDRGGLYLHTGNTQRALKDFQTACGLGSRDGCSQASALAGAGR